MVRLGNMHSACSKKKSPMPDKLDRRNRFKKTLLVKAMELTHAFAPPQGIVEPRSATVVAGDFNMPIGLVDEALREMHSVTWQVSDNDPAGNRDFMFSAGADLAKIATFEKRLNFEQVHYLVAASMVLRLGAEPDAAAGPAEPEPVEPAPGDASASSRGTTMAVVSQTAVRAARERREAARRILRFMVMKKKERKAAQEAKDAEELLRQRLVVQTATSELEATLRMQLMAQRNAAAAAAFEATAAAEQEAEAEEDRAVREVANRIPVDHPEAAQAIARTDAAKRARVAAEQDKAEVDRAAEEAERAAKEAQAVAQAAAAAAAEQVQAPQAPASSRGPTSDHNEEDVDWGGKR